ncbi:membrane protein insertase YidC [Phenylobacterium sp.]|uniref:membrane protein insertase YidC n=1 Tax=Phenylobacterium sp. TaxID=1871053 RepID=UPI0035B1D35F
MPDNSNRNTVIFVVLAFLMLMAYQVFVMGPQAKRREAELKARQGEQAQVVPGAKALDQTQVYLPRAKVVGQSPRLQIDTPSVSGSLSLRGARIDDLFLKGYRETVDPKSPAVELLRPEGAKFAWFAEFGWTGANLPGLPTPDTVWTLVEGQVLSPGKPVVLRYDNGQGLIFTRKIEVDNKFMFTVSDTVANTTGAVLNLTPYGSIQRQGVPVQANGATAHEGALGVLDKELRLIKYKAWKKDGEKNFSSDGGWLGITDKYWLAAMVPDQAENVHASFRVTQAGGVDIYESAFVAQSRNVAPGQSLTHVSRLFAGAKTAPVLKAYQTDLKIPRFVDAVDWGTLYFFTKPIFWLLEQFNSVLHNFGLAILALTVLVKLVFFYPYNLSYASMTKMKKIQPDVEALRTKYKDDPAKQQQEMMALYQREKINPLMGCLPMLATIPVFLALFKVLNVTIEMRHAPFFGWIQDLSAPDPTSIFTLFGLIPWDPSIVPFVGNLIAHLGVWPLAYGITTALSMAMSPPAPDPTQQAMMKMMPIIFTFVLAPLAVGLLIYYSWSNLLTILQQYVVMRRHQVETPIDRMWARLTGKSPATTG